MFTVNRSEYNPLLSPLKEHPWEAAASFNGCPVIHNKKKYLVYRALSEADPFKNNMRTSTVGVASSKDGTHYGERTALVTPKEAYDAYGCEDPRVTKFGDTHYIFYTALGGFPFSADNIKVAVALSKDLKKVDERHLVTPFNAKAMALFPEKINGKMAAILTINTDRKPSDICYAEFDKKEDIWSDSYWQSWQSNVDAHKIHMKRKDTDHLEVGAAPVKTDKGWLMVYSHIQGYDQGNPVFGIEAVLLDLKNPRIVIGKTKGPIMVSDAYYEQVGMVPHLIFPSGAAIEGNKLEIYYGAADTHTAVASIPLDMLLSSMIESENKIVARYPANPIIVPRPDVAWEAGGTFNPASIELENTIYILYRAVSDQNVSTVGLAASHDGFTINDRWDEPIYVPRASFEKRGDEINNHGCEDPRVMLIGKTIYMMYTAYNGSIPRIAVTSISTKDFLKRNWNAWAEPQVLTPDTIDDKDAAILPEPVNGKYMVFHRINNAVCVDFIDSLDFSKERIKECIEIILPQSGMWDGRKVGISSPPVKTKKGWLLFYHGVSSSTTYRVGAVLLDLKDPTLVIARSAAPVFEPEEEYEKNGIVANVVFPCGIIVRKNTIYLYYGGADKVVAVATMKMTDVLNTLKTI